MLAPRGGEGRRWTERPHTSPRLSRLRVLSIYFHRPPTMVFPRAAFDLGGKQKSTCKMALVTVKGGTSHLQLMLTGGKKVFSGPR